MTSLWRDLRFLQTIVHISICIEPTNFILDTNIQHHKVYLIIKVKVTLTDAKGEGQRSQKWIDGYISQTITLTDIIPGTNVHYNKRHLMTWAFLTLT